MAHDDLLEPLPFGPWWEVFRRLTEAEDDDIAVVPTALALSEILQGGRTWPGTEACLRRLEDAAQRAVAQQGQDQAAAARTVVMLLARDGFVGDETSYEDPRNSFLDRVLERRRGLPITLSVLAVHLGRHAGVPLTGVGFPGHFLVGMRLREPEPVVLDPFHGGRRLEGADLEQLLVRATGRRAAAEQERWREYLRPASGRDVIVRMLRNLVMHLHSAKQPGHAAAAQRLLQLAASPEGRSGKRAKD
jgi:regulator of sirC expression with transglutaminase-like and TPR domain